MEKELTPKVQKALEFATAAHRGQFRKNSNLAYITHPIAVREIALELADTWLTENLGKTLLSEMHVAQWLEMVEIVALLHDTIEDVEWVTKELIKTSFGEEIAEFVDMLTKKEGDTYLDAILHAKSQRLTRIVKLADIFHNLSDLKEGQLKQKYLLAQYILKN